MDINQNQLYGEQSNSYVVITPVCHTRTPEATAGRLLQVQSLPSLQSEFKTSRCYRVRQFQNQSITTTSVHPMSTSPSSVFPQVLHDVNRNQPDFLNSKNTYRGWRSVGVQANTHLCTDIFMNIPKDIHTDACTQTHSYVHTHEQRHRQTETYKHTCAYEHCSTIIDAGMGKL